MKDQPERAFPSTFKSLAPQQEQVHMWGMTLRDYFAAKAMQAMLSDAQVLQMMIKGPLGPSSELSDSAYGMADAMMEARK